MRTIRAVTTGWLLVLAAGAAHAQSPPVTVSVTGRMQFQWNSTSVGDDEAGQAVPSSTFETRRIRLGVNVRVSDWIRGTIEPEFALGKLQLRQAWMAFEVDSALVIRAGQFKKPFSLIFLTSSAAHPMIERGLRIRGLAESSAALSTGELNALRGTLLLGEQFTLLESQGYLAYDMGVALEGRKAGFGWSAGVFNGNGPDVRDENDDKSLAARLTYTFDMGTPVTLGGAWSRRELTLVTGDIVSEPRGDAFEVDVEIGGLRRGLWALGEATTGRNLVTMARFTGAQGVVAYFVATNGRRIEGVEPMARVSWADPDDSIDGDAGILFTPGLNLYFFGRNRLMLNWDYFSPMGDAFPAQHAGRAQVNLHF